MNLLREASNILGWSTKRKIVVFESDDWGSIRIASKRAYESMLNNGLNVDESIFTRYDSLEMDIDLERLFEVLGSFKDHNGNNAVFTPMCILANPDFDKIKKSNFHQYDYQTIEETIKEYNKSDNVIKYWKEGAKNRLFVPALHGREHLNVARYMTALNDHENRGTMLAFMEKSFGPTKWQGQQITEYLGAFKPSKETEIKELKLILQDAINLFNKIVGFPPLHFIAPNEIPAKELDETLGLNDIKYSIQPKLRKSPKGNNKFDWELNWNGKKNKFGQTYLMRNAGFEPVGGLNTVDTCLNEIAIAFKWKKPAIISTHRVNYVGRIESKNRDLGLESLNVLLTKILQRWPDVEFMTTMELGQLMNIKE